MLAPHNEVPCMCCYDDVAADAVQYLGHESPLLGDQVPVVTSPGTSYWVLNVSDVDAVRSPSEAGLKCFVINPVAHDLSSVSPPNLRLTALLTLTSHYLACTNFFLGTTLVYLISFCSQHLYL